MVRQFFRLAILAGLLVVAAPFLLSWLLIDTRGVEIQGKVFDKREHVEVDDSTWKRICEVTVTYKAPDEVGMPYRVGRVTPEQFDTMHKGGSARLRYLRREDLPNVPLAQTLRKIGILPTTHVVGEVGADPGAVRGLMWAVCGVVLLVVWRWLQWPGFAWAVAAGVLIFVALMLNAEFPRPTREPRITVRQAAGRVTSIAHITELFETRRSHGMDAAQPIEVVGVEFVPVGKSDPVLAVDLLDQGSIPGMAVGAPMTVEYEDATPRVAQVQGGTRQFAEKNLNGAIAAGAIGAAVLMGIFVAGNWVESKLRGLVTARPDIPRRDRNRTRL
jgi:hypothetical protein